MQGRNRMGMIAWLPEYEIGIQEIDEQHKRLVEIINELYQAIVHEHSDTMADIIRNVVEYTKVHFAIEESLLRIFEYSDYEAHKAEHDRFVAKIQALEQRFAHAVGEVELDLFYLLRDWLIRHIQETDTRYAPTLLRRGAKKRWFKKFW
jgi:hemerythrin